MGELENLRKELDELKELYENHTHYVYEKYVPFSEDYYEHICDKPGEE